MTYTNQPHNNDDEISLKELIRILWNGRWLIVSITVAITVAAGLAAWLIPEKYQATIVISPVSDNSSNQSGGLGSLVSQFGGLASLAGLSAGGDSKKSESLAVLQSETLTEQYIKDNNLLPVLYRDKWDAEKQTWKETDPEKIPTLWKANTYFKNKVRTVASDTKTGLVTLTITWTDPGVAARWANDLVKMTNDYLRNKAIEQSERHIAYLNDQAAKMDAVGVRQAIYAILQTEINKVMLARGSDEYALKVIDPAVQPEKPSSPQKLLWTLAGLFGGIILSVFILIIRPAAVK